MMLLLAEAAKSEIPWILRNPMVMVGGLVLIWWFLVIGPQRKQEKQRKAKLSALKKGDQVLTRAGIVGTVSRVKDDVVVVRIDTDGKVHVPFQLNAIEDVISTSSDE